MASRRQEFKALAKWISMLRPIGTQYMFTAKGQNGRELQIQFCGLENFRGSVSIAGAQLACKESDFFGLMTLFDKNKISFTDVVRLKGLVKNQVERGK